MCSHYGDGVLIFEWKSGLRQKHGGELKATQSVLRVQCVVSLFETQFASSVMKWNATHCLHHIIAFAPQLDVAKFSRCTLEHILFLPLTSTKLLRWSICGVPPRTRLSLWSKQTTCSALRNYCTVMGYQMMQEVMSRFNLQPSLCVICPPFTEAASLQS